MFTLTSTTLPTVPAGDAPPPLWALNTIAHTQAGILALSTTPLITATPTDLPPNPSDPLPVSLTIPLPPSQVATRIQTVRWGQQVLSLAADPSNPQMGEFTYDSLTGRIKIYPKKRSAAPIQVSPADAPRVVEPITDLSLLPELFTRYALSGTVTWGCSWEGHPTGSFEILCRWGDIPAIREQLQPKKSYLSFYGIGFQVDSTEIVKTSPLRDARLEATVRVSLRGKWETLLGQAVLIESENSPDTLFVGTRTPDEQQNQTSLDPNTLINPFNPSDPINSVYNPQRVIDVSKLTRVNRVGGRTIQGRTTVQEIAQRVGAVVNAPIMRVKAPLTVGEEQIVTLGEAFSGQLRHRGMFASYSRSDAIAALSLDAMPTHLIGYGDLQGDALSISVQYYLRAKDYKNSKLEWGSSSAGLNTYLEDTQGRTKLNQPPQWRRKPPKREEITTGSTDVTLPPSEVKYLTESSMAYDRGGPIKERKTTITENGSLIREYAEKWGFLFVACDNLYEAAFQNGSYAWTPIQRDPRDFWRLVESSTTEYLYDDNGYLFCMIMNGTRQARLNAENATESLDAYSNYQSLLQGQSSASQFDLDAARITLDSYRFKEIPIREEKRYFTEKLASHYSDSPKPPTETWTETVPEFSEDGTRRTYPLLSTSRVTGRTEVNGVPHLEVEHEIKVPGFVDPRYCTYEVGRKIAFSGMPDPSQTPDEQKENPLPPLLTGEDLETERIQNVQASGKIETYLEENRVTSAREAGFKKTVKENTSVFVKGRPAEHTHKTIEYEKIDPANPVAPTPYEYHISTVPYPDRRIEGDAANFPYAGNLQEALVGARTEMAIANARETEAMSIQVNFRPEIQEGHLLNLEGEGLQRVLSYQHTLRIAAPRVVEPMPTELSIGRVVAEPAIVVERTPKPTPPSEFRPNPELMALAGSGRIDSGGLVQGTHRGNWKG
jgi:hypothetical protein